MEIKTSKIPATDTQGTKIRAKTSDGAQYTTGYDYAAVDPHHSAAQELADRNNLGTVDPNPVRSTTRGYVFNVTR